MPAEQTKLDTSARGGYIARVAMHGISPEQAAQMRQRVRSFAEDWNVAGMAFSDEL